MSLFDRVSLNGLIKSHLQTFYDDGYFRLHRKKKTPFSDKFIFIIIPSLIAACLVVIGLFISIQYLSIILTCLSIFSGLLFGLLSLVLSLINNTKTTYNTLIKIPEPDSVIQKEILDTEIKYRISKELFINIGFAIFLSLVAIVFTLLTRLKPESLIQIFKNNGCYPLLKDIFIISTNFISYFIISVFILTILMVLKRFYLLFDNEVKD